MIKFALMAVATAGMLSISSCEKNKNKLVGTWNCTSERYSQNGTLQLVFKDDNTIVGTNTTGIASLFDDMNTTYEYKDNLLYINGVKTDSLIFLSDDNILISFLGVILTSYDPEYPSGRYNFERE